MSDSEFCSADLRSNYGRQLDEQFTSMYGATYNPQSTEAQFLRRAFASGIPYGYLESMWTDYQARDRKPLRECMQFAETVRMQSEVNGGFVIIGENGTGKSFLSYMIAIVGLYKGLNVFCFTVLEYLTKKKLLYVNPKLFEEVLKRIDAADLVILDNLNRESEELGWTAQELFEIIDRIVNGRKPRALVMNTNLDKASYETKTGGSVFSRTKYFGKILLKNTDFRSHKADLKYILERRREVGVEAKCYRTSIALRSGSTKLDTTFPVACETCAYKARPYLCELRLRDQWKLLKEKSASLPPSTTKKASKK